MNKLSRRAAIAGGAAALTGSAFYFGTRMRSRPPKDMRAHEMNILCWEGYNSPSVLAPFRKKHHAVISAQTLTNDPAMVRRLRSGENNIWDLINLNNPWARKVLWPEHLIRPLPQEEFEPYFEAMLPDFHPPYHWAVSQDSQKLLGMAQRFGPYSFVANTRKISRGTAEDVGWDLWNEKQPISYGILESADWIVFDIFLIAGIDPFRQHTAAEQLNFAATAVSFFKNAKVVGDIPAMNKALAAGEIDVYLPGGTYSVSPARAEGHMNLRGITPLRGPLRSGRGGIAWIEITSAVNNPHLSPLALKFLKYIQQPEVAHTIAFTEGTCNPVSQMGNRRCFERFSKKELEIIQWDSLAEEMARSGSYDLVPDYNQAIDTITAARRVRE